MKITKYGHACLFLEKNKKILVIDPGCFTELPNDPGSSVVAVIITEEHADHFDQTNLGKIMLLNPSATIYTTQAVGDALSKTPYKLHIVSGVRQIEEGDFDLQFNETDHAPVYKQSPCRSLAVQIDDQLYYPSDSYTTIQGKVKLLALPVSGPWYKVSESIDFANQIDCEQILPTHDAINSEVGNGVAINHIVRNLESPKEILSLEVGQSHTIT